MCLCLWSNSLQPFFHPFRPSYLWTLKIFFSHCFHCAINLFKGHLMDSPPEHLPLQGRDQMECPVQYWVPGQCSTQACGKNESHFFSVILPLLAKRAHLGIGYLSLHNK